MKITARLRTSDECMATDPTSNTRTPPSLRAPNGVLEDSFYQATGRPLWHAANIYVPTLVIAGQFDTWSFPEDRAGLMRTHLRRRAFSYRMPRTLCCLRKTG